MNKTYAMIFAAMCGLAGSTIGLAVNTSGLFYTPVAEAFGTGQGAVALMATIYSFAASGGGFLVSKFVLNRHLKRNVLACIAVQVLTSVLLAFATDVSQLYILNGVRGLASGMLSFVFISTIINNWFQKNHGLTMSIAFAFSGVPGLLLSPVIASVIGAAGWRAGYLLSAAFILLFDLPAILAPLAVHPEDKGLVAYGAGQKAAGAVTTSHVDATAKSAGSLRGTKRNVLAFALVLLFAVPGCIFTVFPQYYLPSLAESLGYAAVTVGMLQSVAMASNMTAKLLFGVLADRIGTGRALVAFCCVSLVAMFLMIPFSGNAAALIVLAFLAGMCFVIPSLGVVFLVQEVFGNEKFAKVYPVVDFTCSISMALGNTAIGMGYDAASSFFPVMLVLAAGMMVALGSLGAIFGKRALAQARRQPVSRQVEAN